MFAVDTTVLVTTGTLTNTMTVTAANDFDRSDNTATATANASTVPDLGVSQTGATSVTAGGTAVFTATVDRRRRQRPTSC